MQVINMRTLRFILLLALIIWLGGILFFGAVMAPTLFQVLPSHLAGLVVSETLNALHWIGIGCAVVIAVASIVTGLRSKRCLSPRLAALAGMLLLTVASRFGITPRMEQIRESVTGGEVQRLPDNDPLRVRFDRLHHWSTRLEMGVLVLGLFVVADIARE